MWKLSTIGGLLILAAFADAATFILMGTAHELNPIARTYPEAAIAAKAALAALILIAPLQQYRRPVIAIGITAWTIGAITNLSVLLAA